MDRECGGLYSPRGLKELDLTERPRMRTGGSLANSGLANPQLGVHVFDSVLVRVTKTASTIIFKTCLFLSISSYCT